MFAAKPRTFADFEWDDAKAVENLAKHGVSFIDAQFAFADQARVIVRDGAHSYVENRYFCFGLNREKTGILTVRFTRRNERIRIIGAGYWRKGRQIYERENSIQR